MATDHEYWRGQSEIYALGALDGEELDEFQAHLAAGCPLCDATVRETGESLALLPASLEPLTPSPALRGRILEQIDHEKVVPISAAKTIGSPRRQRMIGTIAAGIIGVLLGGGYYYFRYEPRHTLYTSVINLLRDPSTRDYPLYGAGPTPTAKGRFLWNESGEGHIFVSNLPAPPEGKMYAVWTIAQSSAAALRRRRHHRRNRPGRPAHHRATRRQAGRSLRRHARTGRHHRRSNRSDGAGVEAILTKIVFDVGGI